MHIFHAPCKSCANIFRFSLKLPRYRTGYQRPFRRQSHALAKPEDAITHVAVLGGGISGLASAYFLSRKLPSAKIVLYERSSRLGGWLYSEQVDVSNGRILFERGPRSIRPNTSGAKVTLGLISELGLEPRLLKTSIYSTAARNRFIYYPDHLVRMPALGQSPLEIFSSLLSEPVFNGIFRSIFMEPWQPSRPEDLIDESIGSFLSRRLGSPLFADNIVSAVFHGIYAGDIYQLSVRSLLPLAWQFEGRYGTLFKAYFAQLKGNGAMPSLEQDLALLKQQSPISMEGQSVYTFIGGIEDLTGAIAAALKNNPNIEIRKETSVAKLTLEEDKPDPKIKITSSSAISPPNNSTDTFSHVISAISGTSLDKLANLPLLSLTPSVTVMVVNLYFSQSNLLSVRGFGYLIPRTVPFEQNPELALGVVFDSDVSVGQDTVPGTKVTVMLGGHWWNDWDVYPDEEEGGRMARAVLERHLGITEEPQVVRVALQKNCIPQYTVGHEERMAATSHLLEKFQGRLRVTGSSYTGVGLNECVRAAKNVVDGLVDGTGKTGLDSFVGRKWVWVDTKEYIQGQS